MIVNTFDKCHKFELLKDITSRLDSGENLQFTNIDNTKIRIRNYRDLIRVASVIDEGNIETIEHQLYRVGQKFVHFDCAGVCEQYMLTCVDATPGTALVGLICLEDGNRWSSPVWVVDSKNITSAEFDRITGNQCDEFKEINYAGIYSNN